MKVMLFHKENRRVIVDVLPDLRHDQKGNYYWKGGIPINPKIPKMLVRITDKLCQDRYYPTDKEFALLTTMMDKESINLIKEAFEVKEEWNSRNLKNPEPRKIERLFGHS